MKSVGGAYLPLVRPRAADPTVNDAISTILALVGQVESRTISDLIIAASGSWRETIVGLVLAAGAGPRAYVPAMLTSLAKPRGLAIVPTFAVVTVSVRSSQPEGVAKDLACLDRSAFSGELGWAIDKFLFHTGIASTDVARFSPNDGAVFEHHLQVYEDIGRAE